MNEETQENTSSNSSRLTPQEIKSLQKDKKETMEWMEKEIERRNLLDDKPPMTSERAKAQIKAGKKQMAEWLRRNKKQQ